MGRKRIDRAEYARRFWERVDQFGECWPWLGRVWRDGYGKHYDYDTGNGCNAHRVAFVLTNGPVKAGLHVDHICRNRVCVRPDHLRAVTSVQNTMEARSLSLAAINSRKTHCKHGHPLDEENTRISASGTRQCRTCIRARVKDYVGRNREKHNEWVRRSRIKNAERVAESKRRYVEEHREEVKARKHRWYEANREHAAKKGRERYSANREEIIAREKARRERIKAESGWVPQVRTSRYRGVSWDKARERWRASIQLNRKQKMLGRFGTEVEAAMAYDQAACQLLGSSAALNFPERAA